MKKLIGAMVLVAGLAFGDAGDPPARVARLNYLNGSVSFQPAGVDDWTPAAINYPMTTGDHLWVDTQSRAEMHIGSTAIHADAGTASSFLNLDDRTVQIQLTQGSLYIRIRYMADDDVYEIDTPNGAISLLRTGTYRIDVDPDRQTSTITVRGGEAEVTSNGSAFPVRAREAGIITGSDSPSTETRGAVQPIFSTPGAWDVSAMKTTGRRPGTSRASCRATRIWTTTATGAPILNMEWSGCRAWLPVGRRTIMDTGAG